MWCLYFLRRSLSPQCLYTSYRIECCSTLSNTVLRLIKLPARLILNNTNYDKDIFKYQNAPICTSSFGFYLFLIVVNAYILFHVHMAMNNLNTSLVPRNTLFHNNLTATLRYTLRYWRYKPVLPKRLYSLPRPHDLHGIVVELTIASYVINK